MRASALVAVYLLLVTVYSTTQATEEDDQLLFYRTWTSSRGTTVEAALKNVDDDKVTLIKRDKKIIRIDKAQLSLKDRAFLEGGFALDEEPRTWTKRTGEKITAIVFRQENNDILLQVPEGRDLLIRRSELCDEDLVWLDMGFMPNADKPTAYWWVVNFYIDLKAGKINTTRERMDGKPVFMPYAARIGRKYLERAAELGDVQAQFQMGYQLSTGEHPAFEGHTDPSEARKWYRLAARQDHVDALYNLAICESRANPTLAAEYFNDAGRKYAKNGRREMALKTVDRLRDLRGEEAARALKILVDQTFADYAAESGVVLFDPAYLEDPVALLVQRLKHEKRNVATAIRFAELASFYCVRGQTEKADDVLQLAVKQGEAPEAVIKTYYSDVKDLAVEALQAGNRRTFDELNKYLHHPPHRDLIIAGLDPKQQDKVVPGKAFTAYPWYNSYCRDVSEAFLSRNNFGPALRILLTRNAETPDGPLPPAPSPEQIAETFGIGKDDLLLLCRIAAADTARRSDEIERLVAQIADNYMQQERPVYWFHCAAIHKMLGNEEKADALFKRQLSFLQYMKKSDRPPLCPWSAFHYIGPVEKLDLAILYHKTTRNYIDTLMAELSVSDRLFSESLLMRLAHKRRDKEETAQRLSNVFPAVVSADLSPQTLLFVGRNLTEIERPDLALGLVDRYVALLKARAKKWARGSASKDEDRLRSAYWNFGLYDKAWEALDKEPYPEFKFDFDKPMPNMEGENRKHMFWFMTRTAWVQNFLAIDNLSLARSYIRQTRTTKHLMVEVGKYHIRKGEFEKAFEIEGDVTDVCVELLKQLAKKRRVSPQEKDALRTAVAKLTE